MYKTLSLTDYRTYGFAALFVIGNILFPQLCHLIPQGGLIFLPIYFFTLIGAYRFGLNVGLLTAIVSPLVNCFFFGMPPVASLPAIMVKSVALALAASFISRKYARVSVPLLLITVVAYQVVGMTFECLKYDAAHATQDVRLGYPGLLIQVLIGYVVLKKMEQI